MVKRAESAATTQRYLQEAQDWVEDHPTRAAELARSGGCWNLRRGGRLIAQYRIVEGPDGLDAQRVPEDEMDHEDDPADLARLAAERDAQLQQDGQGP